MCSFAFPARYLTLTTPRQQSRVAVVNFVTVRTGCNAVVGSIFIAARPSFACYHSAALGEAGLTLLVVGGLLAPPCRNDPRAWSAQSGRCVAGCGAPRCLLVHIPRHLH